MWCMQRTNIYLEDRQTAALDHLAEEEGVSRAELIRRIIDRSLAGRDTDLATDLARLDVAFGTPIDIEVPRRDPDERAHALEKLMTAE